MQSISNSCLQGSLAKCKFPVRWVYRLSTRLHTYFFLHTYRFLFQFLLKIDQMWGEKVEEWWEWVADFAWIIAVNNYSSWKNVQSPDWVLSLWKSGTITVNRGKRTGKRRLFAKSQHLTGRILLRTGTNTQEGDIKPGLLKLLLMWSKINQKSRFLFF